MRWQLSHWMMASLRRISLKPAAEGARGMRRRARPWPRRPRCRVRLRATCSKRASANGLRSATTSARAASDGSSSCSSRRLPAPSSGRSPAIAALFGRQLGFGPLHRRRDVVGLEHLLEDLVLDSPRRRAGAVSISFCIAWYSRFVLTSISWSLNFDSRPCTAARSFSSSRRAAWLSAARCLAAASRALAPERRSSRALMRSGCSASVRRAPATKSRAAGGGSGVRDQRAWGDPSGRGQ